MRTRAQNYEYQRFFILKFLKKAATEKLVNFFTRLNIVSQVIDKMHARSYGKCLVFAKPKRAL